MPYSGMTQRRDIHFPTPPTQTVTRSNSGGKWEPGQYMIAMLKLPLPFLSLLVLDFTFVAS